LALALSGRERDEVLFRLLELLAEREMATGPEPQDRSAAENLRVSGGESALPGEGSAG